MGISMAKIAIKVISVVMGIAPIFGLTLKPGKPPV